jgi:sterol desaturase/sphingolipid hydroxylase (fatty acid hydroxylase superfamily)
VSNRISQFLGGLIEEWLRTGAMSAFANLVFLIMACLLFFPLENLLEGRRRTERPRPRRVERLADLLHAVVNPSIAAVTAVTVGILLNPSAAEMLLQPVLGDDIAEKTEGWLRWFATFGRDLDREAHLPLAMLLSAFFGYWLHRALHEWSFLWRLHAVHHSSERVDWLSAHRQHPIEVMMIVVVTVAPPVILGLAPETIAGVVVFQKLHLFLSHSNTRLPFGPLRYLFVTPRHHHWHHEVDARCNYAGLFPFLDVIFGTYHDAPWFPTQTGSSSHVHTGWIAHLVHPLRRRRWVEADVCWCRVPLDQPLYGRAAEQALAVDPEQAFFDAAPAERPRAEGTRADETALTRALAHVIATS